MHANFTTHRIKLSLKFEPMSTTSDTRQQAWLSYGTKIPFCSPTAPYTLLTDRYISYHGEIVVDLVRHIYRRCSLNHENESKKLVLLNMA